MLSSWFSILLSIFVVLLIVYKKTERRRLPPGPLPIPVLGNVYGIDIGHPWKTYVKWGKKYGDIIYTRLLTEHIIVINSEKVAKELLEKRSNNYSSRPESISTMANLIGNEFSSIFLPYGDRWRLHRRLFHQAFQLSAVPSLRPIQMRKSHDLIMRLLSNPYSYSEHLEILGISIMMSIVYDYDVSTKDDPIVANVERVLSIAVKELRPEVTALVSALPILKYLPAWFPGAGFQRNAFISRSIVSGWVEAPFEYVKKNMAEGTAGPSMVSDALLSIRNKACAEDEAALLEKAVKEACASVYAAATETTHSTLMVFMLAMVLYPDVQAQAQAEIDSVIGNGLPRLPCWDDQPSLPFIGAILKETLRWHPVVPLGLPHATMEDDIYEGYYIPKGATVIANAWAMSQDPVTFPEPEKFKPERFLGEQARSIDELPFAFGFGRRVCVGRYVADASLWISIVSMLAVFRFEVPPSWDPGPDGVNVEWTEGVTARPKNVPCVARPRHENLSSERLTHLVGLAGL